MTFLSPGPPGYAARCRKPVNHDGDCEFEPPPPYRRKSAVPLFMEPDHPQFLGLLKIDIETEIANLRIVLENTEHDLKIVATELEKMNGK